MATQQNIELITKVTPLPPERQHQLETLTRVNTGDLLGAFGLGDLRYGRALLARVCRDPAQRFAQHVIAYDDQVGAHGLQTGGAWAVKQFGARLHISGQANIPSHGPVLIVSNHPGLCDTAALFAAIDRPDLRVIATRRPFLQALPHTSRHLLYIDDSTTSRLGTLRAVARHLQQGGVVLTFPAGQIEPDPATLPGAVAALDRWSSSIDVVARFVDQITIVPVIVSGVLPLRALRHPLTRLRRRQRDREWLAALLQIQVRALQQVTVNVSFGHPIHSVARNGSVRDAVIDQARRLIELVPAP